MTPISPSLHLSPETTPHLPCAIQHILDDTKMQRLYSLSYYDWPLSLGMFEGSYVLECVFTLSSYLCNGRDWIVTHCLEGPHSIHSLRGHWLTFAMWSSEQRCNKLAHKLWKCLFSPLLGMELLAKSLVLCATFEITNQHGFTSAYSHRRGTRVFISSYLCQQLSSLLSLLL